VVVLRLRTYQRRAKKSATLREKIRIGHRVVRAGYDPELLTCRPARAPASTDDSWCSGSHQRRWIGALLVSRRGLAPSKNPPPASALRQASAAPLRSCANRSQRSEEHTSELQSRENLVCRLLL